MKTIQAVTIWDKGTSKQASILNAYAINVTLNTSATFYYALLNANEDGSQGEVLTQGNLSMVDEDYAQWIIDQDAWDYIAKSLNLELIGDYIAPVIEEAIVEAPVVEAPVVFEYPVRNPIEVSFAPVVEAPIIEAPVDQAVVIEETIVEEASIVLDPVVEVAPIVEENILPETIVSE